MRVSIHQRLPVPQPDIVDGCPVGLERFVGQILRGWKRSHLDVMQVIGHLRQRDVVLNIGPLPLQLVGFDEDALEQSGHHAGQHEGRAIHRTDRDQRS